VATIKRYLLFAFASIGGFLPYLGYAQSLDSLRREFENSPREVRPMVRWWWPGSNVTADELRREVRGTEPMVEMKKAEAAKISSKL